MKGSPISRKAFSFITKGFLSLLVLYMAYTGCIKVPKEEIQITLTVSNTSLSFPFPGEQQTFTVNSNDSWTVGSSASWLTVSPSSGTVNVTAETNPSTSQREATITVSSRLQGVPEQTVTATQAGAIIEPEMVFVQGGTFMMGCNPGNEPEMGGSCYDDELPAHRVTLSSFYIGKYEVTQAQWEAVMDYNPSYFIGENRPVETVRWDIEDFITRLNIITGKQYRLPTEAEWEYAARGGHEFSSYLYSGSNNVDDVAWYSGNSGGRTHNVGGKSPNALGIYDMSGNVLELCSDWYDPHYYSISPSTNPQSSSGYALVMRGGCWDRGSWRSRVSHRDDNMRCSPNYGEYTDGFRLVLSSK